MSHVDSQVQRMWWWRSHGQRRRIDDSDPGSRAPRPTHLTPNPSLHVIHTTFNLHKHDPCWAQERRWREDAWEGQKRMGRDGAGAASPSTRPFPPLDSSSYKSAHHYLRCTQVWVTAGWSFGTKAVSENTQIVWMIIIGFFVFLGGFGCVSFCLYWDFFFFLAVLHVVSAVAGRIDQRADRSKENYSFGQAARAMIDEC